MKAKLTNPRDRILWFYLKYPTREFHLRELSRESEVSFPWTRKIVGELAEQKLIMKKKERNLVLTKANTETIEYQILKRAHNLISIYECGLVEYIIEKFGNPEAIIMFGSFEKGMDIEESDVDIAVFSKRNPKLILKKFENQLHRKISIQVLDRNSLDKEFLTSLANGTMLSGYLEL